MTSRKPSSALTPPTFASWPHFESDEVEAAAAVLRSGKVNYWGGQEGALFEAEFADFVQAKYAIAAANGTLALEMALHGLRMQPGDEVIVPSRTYIATAAAVAQRGGVPVCADIDSESGNITADTIAEQITPKTRGVIVVHMAGWPCDMDPIIDLAEEHGLFVIEDCAQAHGAMYKGRHVGSIGDAGAFSFCQDKIMTTAGEGGMLVTNRSDVFENAWRLKDHGRHPDVYFNRRNFQPGVQFKYLVDEFGSNMRMTEVQAAVGRRALSKLPSWVETRRRHAHALAAACANAGLHVPMPRQGFQHSYYRFHAYVRPGELADGWTRDRILHEMRERGVPCLSGTCFEIFREAAFPIEWKPQNNLTTAFELGRTSLCWLTHPTLSDEAIRYCRDVIGDVMAAATGQTQTYRAAA